MDNHQSEDETTSTTTQMDEVNQLKAALQSAQEQINDLQSDLQQQTTLVGNLQAELKLTNQFKTELEQAKQTILQLLEYNSIPPEVVNSIEKKPNPPTQERFNPRNTRTQIPHHSMQPDSRSIVADNTDFSWVD